MLMQSNNVPPFIYNRVLSIREIPEYAEADYRVCSNSEKANRDISCWKWANIILSIFCTKFFLSFREHAKYHRFFIWLQRRTNSGLVWPSAITKVFYNLISNALKYTPKNGNITLQVEQDSEYVVVKVIDSGHDIKLMILRRYLTDSIRQKTESISTM